jgi:hypothetical protein
VVGFCSGAPGAAAATKAGGLACAGESRDTGRCADGQPTVTDPTARGKIAYQNLRSLIIFYELARPPASAGTWMQNIPQMLYPVIHRVNSQKGRRGYLRDGWMLPGPSCDGKLWTLDGRGPSSALRAGLPVGSSYSSLSAWRARTPGRTAGETPALQWVSAAVQCGRFGGATLLPPFAFPQGRTSEQVSGKETRPRSRMAALARGVF